MIRSASFLAPSATLLQKLLIALLGVVVLVAGVSASEAAASGICDPLAPNGPNPCATITGTVTSDTTGNNTHHRKQHRRHTTTRRHHHPQRLQHDPNRHHPNRHRRQLHLHQHSKRQLHPHRNRPNQPHLTHHQRTRSRRHQQHKRHQPKLHRHTGAIFTASAPANAITFVPQGSDQNDPAPANYDLSSRSDQATAETIVATNDEVEAQEAVSSAPAAEDLRLAEPSSGPAPLAFTGASSSRTVTLSLALLAAGAVFVVVARRSTRHED